MTLSLGFIGIVTNDLPASLAFYRGIGVEIADGQDDAPHVDATLADGSALAWDTVATIREFDPDYEPPTGGLISLAFAKDSPAAVDRTYAEVVGAGYRGNVEPFDASWGQRWATVLDPDGNQVSFYAPLAAS